MVLYFFQELDINIPFSSENGMFLHRGKRESIAQLLFEKYLEKDTVNSARSLAYCPICKDPCTYFSGEKDIQLGSCSIIDRREGFNILISVEWIHVLQKHESMVDEKLIEYFMEK
ncbi:MAG TPA: hypothetical protein VN030_09195 [Cellvibrio sp.]|nr:hypothetical protein [Cellvibrio sp.]